MAKRDTKVHFVCQECGYESPEWLGKCPECGSWNSLREFKEISNKQKAIGGSQPQNIKPQKLHEITYSEKSRLLTGFSELDTVLGGGIVGGSVTLLAGDPGIGKSTLLLQVGLNISSGDVILRSKATKDLGTKILRSPSVRLGAGAQNDKLHKVLYVSGEESNEQIKLRAERILNKNARVQNDNFLLLSLNNTDAIISAVADEKPSLVVIDSIQTMESEAVGGLSGSVPQIRYAAGSFIRFAKQNNIPIILVGHVTKEGMVAGPMVLSHMVDTVLFFEGEKTTNTRILRSFKNRFGPVDEVGVFSMEGNGISEVKDPQHLFLTENAKSTVGSVITATIEGSRVFLVEIQGLTVFSKLPMPRRVVSGVDAKRVELLLAVLQKYCNIPTSTMDVFVNVAGGLKLTDRAVDLAVCLALYSSFKNIPLSKTIAIGEIGLLGEIRGVPLLEKRVKEAQKRGFKTVLAADRYSRLYDVIKSLK